MDPETIQKEILKMHKPFGYKNIRVFNNGLSASMWFQSVPLISYMSPTTRALPVSILAAMKMLAHSLTFYNPDFIFLQSYLDASQQKSLFFTFIQYLPTEKFYNFLKTEIDTIDLVNNTVKLKRHVFWEIETVHITRKNYIICEKLYAAENSECLATINMGYGIVNLKKRTVDYLPDSIVSKASSVKVGQKPSYINILNVPHDAGVIKTQTTDVVSESNLDGNNHANFSYYLSFSMDSISTLSNMLGKGMPMYKEFSIVFRNESVLGDELQNISWRSDGNYYCKIKKNQKDVTFVKSSCFSNNNLARL